jgi:outer membrane receptor protein involved in Fe transport
MIRRSHIAALVTTALVSSIAASPAFAQAVVSFNLPVQELSKSLKSVARATNTNIVFNPSLVQGKQAPPLRGQFDAETAIARLIAGQALAEKSTGSGTFVISGSPPRGNAPAATEAAPSLGEASPGSTAAESERAEDRAIVVTGTNIRGGANASSPLQLYTRDDMDRAGQRTVKDLIQALPQNFNGVANENTIQNIAGGNAAGVNYTFGTGINLHGAGPGATLVLVDGRRLAPANLFADFVDISLIPTAALERVEVLPDGASAIYGSDAIGGVVNFIFRKNFDGAESRGAIGTTTEGGGRLIQVSETLGKTWGSGSALATYEFFDQNRIRADQRSFTRTAAEPTDLLPSQARHSAVVNLEQRVGSTTTLFADGLYGHRRSVTTTTSPLGFGTTLLPKVEVWSGRMGARTDFGPQELELSLSHSIDKTSLSYTDLFSGSSFGKDRVRSQLTSFDAKIDGPLLQFGPGAIRYALGGQYRDETFRSAGFTAGLAGVHVSRHVYAGFAELNVPFAFQAEGRSAGAVDVAIRHEHYSDFGSTTNPKVGIWWEPITAFRLRGSYSRSFRAPTLNDLSPVLFNVWIIAQNDPVLGGQTNTLVEAGGNPGLGPERAKTITLGFDYGNGRSEGPKAAVTYYWIDYTGRISNISDAGCHVFTGALGCPLIQGTDFIHRNPTVSTLAQIIASSAAFFNYTGQPLTTVGAFVDSRQFNLSSFKTSGIDFDLSHAFEAVGSEWRIGLVGAYLFHYKQKLLSTLPAVSTLNTPYNPVDLRMRARLLASKRNWTAGVFVNYTDSYKDNRTTPSKRIKSYTTADVTLEYKVPRHGFLREASVDLAVRNITNTKPPFVLGSSSFVFPGINYDATNANPIGRTVSLQVTGAF